MIQQAHGNVIPLLDKATSRSAMVRMLTERVDPRNYQRPTAAPTAGQVQNAISALGDFSNRVMTHDEAAALPYAIRLRSTTAGKATSSSMATFKDMLAATRKKNPAGFAGRCGPTSTVRVETVTDLLTALRADPGKRLEVRTRGMPDVYLATTTLEPAKLCVPHLWAYTGTHGAGYFPDEWSEVAVVNPLFEYVTIYKSVFFLPKNVRPPATIGNCCFPEFLETSLRRTCRTAFEEMNRRLRLAIDKAQGTVAVGVGVCATNERGDLRTPLTVRLDGREFTIRRL